LVNSARVRTIAQVLMHVASEFCCYTARSIGRRGMDGDLHEQLGQLIAYARSVGVKPPWTK